MIHAEVLVFPRLNRRGLIEAGCVHGGPFPRLHDFRALTGAASLKLDVYEA